MFAAARRRGLAIAAAAVARTLHVMRVIRIADIQNRAFLHLSIMLNALPPEVADLHWSILDLGEAFAPNGSHFDVLAVERRVQASASGLHLTYNDLLLLASRLQQVVDGLFVATTDPTRLPVRNDPDDVVLAKSDVVLAAVDSSFWYVSARDDMLDRIRAQFEHASDEDPGAVQLSAWGR
jgi:hypothetical protein